MNTFSCASVAAIISGLQGLACRCLQEETSTGKGALADDALLNDVRYTLEQLIWLDTQAEFHSKGLAASSLTYIQRDPDVTTLKQHLTIVGNQLVLDLTKHSFLWVAPDRKAYVEDDRLFDTDVVVSQAFPSARQDIKEAGNCLAAECNTAAVFHLMRAAEFALRALARDREVEFTDKPLDQKEWVQILNNLQGKLKKLEDVEKNWGWPDTVVREAQIRFYAEAIQELRGFKDAWRRHVSHADRDAFYNRESAMGVFTHVRAFMRKLATKISETSKTPTYWIEL